MSSADSDMVVARITIERVLRSDGTDMVTATSEDETGEHGLPVVLALGMLRLAEGIVLATADEDDEP